MASEQFLVTGRFRFRLGTDNLICKHLIKVIRFWISGEMATDEIVAEVDHLDSKTIFRISKEHVIVSMPQPILVRRDKRVFGAQGAIGFSKFVF